MFRPAGALRGAFAGKTPQVVKQYQKAALGARETLASAALTIYLKSHEKL